ncbi:TolC family outer membrane protein [Sphingomonas sp. AX6]|uniref:TolC family outer membrane protein n=1 Tax=Sphingomonas sp. AX6 TaxID=2653171 RepID=UPI0012EF5E56|nr:TolC family outer membrane protein [Sphingomonas sp. AX6]VXC77214.1 Type I secretion outer membrane protein, TolC precursor [Sphingomonas sp. AX6]
MPSRLLILSASIFALSAPAITFAQTIQPLPVRPAPQPVSTVGESTLGQALARAYRGNPTLAAERANLRANDENVPIARSAGLPRVVSSGTYLENLHDSSNNDSVNSFGNPARQVTAGVDLTVPIYSGGAVRNSVRAAETRVRAGRADLRTVEANIFTDVVAAYMDVIRDESIVALNQQNVRVLDVNLQASRDRFELGDLTRTDVAQSEARLAISQGQLRSAEAQLISSRENYIRVVGEAPGALASPPPLPGLPGSVEDATRVALDQNPGLDSIRLAAEASDYDIDVARAARLPRLSGFVGGDYSNFLGSLGSGTGVDIRQDSTSAQAGLTLSMPLFQGGLPAAQVRQAQARRSQTLEIATEVERGVVAQTRSAFAVWQSAQRVIAFSQVAVDANRLSLEGVRAENSVGTRTILDILDAERELLNSQVTLVAAQRDAYVAGFALLAAMGQAEARDLGLDGGPLYDPTVNYNRVRGRISDWADDPEPVSVSTTTTATPAQNATVVNQPDPSTIARPPETPVGD